MTIIEAYKNWASVNLDEIVITTAREKEREIIEAQKDQIRHGINSEGGDIGQYRSKDYADLKDAYGLQEPAPYGKVNLFYSGSFTNKIKLDYTQSLITPESTDEKNNKLLKKYGETIYGLAPKWLYPLIEKHFRPILPDKIRKRVQL